MKSSKNGTRHNLKLEKHEQTTLAKCEIERMLLTLGLLHAPYLRDRDTTEERILAKTKSTVKRLLVNAQEYREREPNNLGAARIYAFIDKIYLELHLLQKNKKTQE